MDSKVGIILISQQLKGQLKCLQALDLGRGGIPGNYMVEEIWQELAKARYTEWEQGAAIRRQQQPALKCVYILNFNFREKHFQLLSLRRFSSLKQHMSS